MYPVKNLEDFYDKEGFRDGEFDKNDKGTWVLNSRMAIKRKSDNKLIVKGMILRINRNTRISEGENVKQLRRRYDIPTEKAPKLKLKGVGELKGSSVGYKDLEIDFGEGESTSIYYSDIVNFKPSRDKK